jgi:hypothetical protein
MKQLRTQAELLITEPKASGFAKCLKTSFADMGATFPFTKSTSQPLAENSNGWIEEQTETP